MQIFLSYKMISPISPYIFALCNTSILSADNQKEIIVNPESLVHSTSILASLDERLGGVKFEPLNAKVAKL